MSRSTNDKDSSAEIVSEEAEDSESNSLPSSAVVHREPFGPTRFGNFDFDRHFVVKLIDEGSEALSALGKVQLSEPELTLDECCCSAQANVQQSGDTGRNFFNIITSNIPRLYSAKEPVTSPSNFNNSATNRKSIADSHNIQHECVRQPWSAQRTPVRRKPVFSNDSFRPPACGEDVNFNSSFWKPLERTSTRNLKFATAGGDTIPRAVTANPSFFESKTAQTDELTSVRDSEVPAEAQTEDVKDNKEEPTSNTCISTIRPKTAGPGIRKFMALDPNCNITWDRFSAQKTSEAQRSILATCSQRQPVPIHLIFEYLISVKKVGEGVYGEVYKGYHRYGTELRVFKIIPIEGSKVVNGEKQKKFQEIEPEILIAQEVNKLRKGINGCKTNGHSKLIDAKICVGSYPAILTQQWKVWHKIHLSQNDLPSFDQTQLYAMLEFDFHGADVETYQFKNAKQSLSVLLNVVYTLAASEVGIQFEHRDLHWGNILVLRTREGFSSYTIKGKSYRVPNCGLKTTLIDYTISRVTSSKKSGEEAVFTDLSNDEDQFCGSEEYQFEIYRMMRRKNNNNWKPFCPKSNVYWTHYLVGKLIDKAQYLEPTSVVHRCYTNKLLRIQASILKYESCWDCVQNFLTHLVKEIESES